MVPIPLRWLVPATLCAAALAVQAQSAAPVQATSAAPAARPDPLDAKASVPAFAYESAFARFRPLGEDKMISWREANDAVARIGGWRVYAREAQEPIAAPPATTPATPPPTSSAAAPAPAAPAAGKDAAKPMPMPPGHGAHKTP
jgi:hypothetical protein